MPMLGDARNRSVQFQFSLLPWRRLEPPPSKYDPRNLGDTTLHLFLCDRLAESTLKHSMMNTNSNCGRMVALPIRQTDLPVRLPTGNLPFRYAISIICAAKSTVLFHQGFLRLFVSILQSSNSAHWTNPLTPRSQTYLSFSMEAMARKAEGTSTTMKCKSRTVMTTQRVPELIMIYISFVGPTTPRSTGNSR